MFLTWTSVKVPRPKSWCFLPGQVLKFLDLRPGVSLTWTNVKFPRPKAWCFLPGQVLNFLDLRPGVSDLDKC